MWQDDAERRERTKVVPIEPGSYIVSPASKVRAVMRCTHAIHFAGGIERLKRHETMSVLLKILVRTSLEVALPDVPLQSLPSWLCWDPVPQTIPILVWYQKC